MPYVHVISFDFWQYKVVVGYNMTIENNVNKETMNKKSWLLGEIVELVKNGL